MEESAFPSDPIKGWRLNDRVIFISRGMWPPPVIGDAEENIWAFFGAEWEDEEKEKEEAHEKGLRLSHGRCFFKLLHYFL